MKTIILTGVILTMIPVIHLNAQEEKLSKEQRDSIFIATHSPRKATMYSAVLPGLGQIYNRKYWKVPVVYAGFATLAYFIDYNNEQYLRFKTAYLYRIDGDETTVDEFAGRYSDQALQSGKDTYRRWRDLNIIGVFGLYAFQIIDATVDAYLFDYDIGDDLSLRVAPSVIGNDYNLAVTPGITCTFRF